VHSDGSVHEYLESMNGQPCYVALQGEGREWMTLTSPESMLRFDYLFTRCDDLHRRHRQTHAHLDSRRDRDHPDKQAFMEMYVKRIVGVMREPIDIYANATYLPAQIPRSTMRSVTPSECAK